MKHHFSSTAKSPDKLKVDQIMIGYFVWINRSENRDGFSFGNLCNEYTCNYLVKQCCAQYYLHNHILYVCIDDRSTGHDLRNDVTKTIMISLFF